MAMRLEHVGDTGYRIVDRNSLERLAGDRVGSDRLQRLFPARAALAISIDSGRAGVHYAIAIAQDLRHLCDSLRRIRRALYQLVEAELRVDEHEVVATNGLALSRSLEPDSGLYGHFFFNSRWFLLAKGGRGARQHNGRQPKEKY